MSIVESSELESDLAHEWSSHQKRSIVVDEYIGDVCLTGGPVADWDLIPRTNIRPIDRDHCDLVRLINKLALLLERDATPQVVALAIEQFNQYATEHFRREENLMRIYQFPDFYEHRKKHLMFRKYFLAIRLLYTDTPDSIDMDRVLLFLTEWLINHVGKSDLAIAEAVAVFETEGEEEHRTQPFSLSEMEVDRLLKEAQSVLTTPSPQSVELQRAIHDLHVEQILDMDLDEAREIMQPFLS